MADPQQGRAYRPNPPVASARDEAFSNIFGAAPPPGRSNTMTSQSSMMAPGRSQTMTSLSGAQNGYGGMDGAPGGQHKSNGYPGNQPPNGYPPPMAPQYQQGGPNGYYQQPPQQHMRPNQQQQQPPMPPHSQAPMHPQQRPYAPNIQPDRRPYPQAQRFAGGPPNPGFQKPLPNRFYGQPGPGVQPGPAMNNDPYRSRSMAASSSFNQIPGGGGGGMHHPGGGGGGGGGGGSHQVPYGPPGANLIHARQTAQGRHIPERPDERTMSMTAYPADRDGPHTQTMSGRVIPQVPHRRRDSGGEMSAFTFTEQQKQGGGPDQNFYSPTDPKATSPSSDHRSSSGLRQDQRDSQSSIQSSVRSRIPSYASTSSSVTAVGDSLSLHSRPSVMSKGTPTSSQSTIVTASRRAPLVYPALLSRVADTFREKLSLGDRIKNELTYKSGFTGAEAVDMIAYIIKTSDRNLALLLGRALDAQKFFHDVTYDHRLRDSASEVYQFRERLVDEEGSIVNGVFTLLTECYSPTCTRDRLCYSIACPRRLEQQARLKMEPLPGLKRESSRTSLHDQDDKEQKLWIHSVPKEVAESVDEKEKRRQEVICEAIYTERDFVKDLEYLRDFWITPLRSKRLDNPSPLGEHRREKFILTVFSNVLEVHRINSKLADALTRRQQQQPVVRNIGDIFLEFVPLFEPFIKYGANQLYGKYEFEKEKSTNTAFQKFVEDTERMKESRKLELNGYLTKPTTRLARYPLLLEAVLKSTADDNPDKQDLPKAIEAIRACLSKVNIESGRAENHFNLVQLDQQLIFPNEKVDLKLTEEGRQLIFKGNLKKSPTDAVGNDIQAYLFDHALLLVRIKVVNKREQFKVYRRPIPLELLVITEMQEVLPNPGRIMRPPSSLLPGANRNSDQKRDPNAKGYPITFQHLGRRGYNATLWATTVVGRKKWMEHIQAQQNALSERSNVFTKTILCEEFFNVANNRVNCLVPMDGGRKLVYGTDTGIFVSDRKLNATTQNTPKKIIDIPGVAQVDVLEEYQILLALSDKSVFSFPMESLMEGDTALVNKRHKKIMGHTNFFKAGVCLGRVLVCCVKSSTMSSTVKVLEPLDNLSKGKRQPALRKLLVGGQEALKPFKEFYIPSESSSVHFLKSKLCVGCAKGFEVVSLETLETQSLLDPADTSLDFVQRRENVKPIAIYRLNGGEFLLNYSDFSFFVNRNGWRARPDWIITWEGCPTSFALQPPYILAFEPSFIEIRNMETGGLVSIITGKNIRMLHESSREILYAYEEDTGTDVIASLDFWSKPRA